MKDFRSALIPALALTAMFGLAACSDGHSKTEKPASGDALPADLTLAPLQNCPQASILQQAQTVTLFLPGRSDIAAQISTARMNNLSGACTLNKPKKALEVQFTVQFSANNGPANAGKPIILPWFVAITKGDQIIEKQDYKITLRFNGNMSTAVATSKPIKIEVPNIPASAALEILTGFQMSQAQLDYQAANPTASLLP